MAWGLVSLQSCRDLYDCSHKDLDALVEICKSSGGLGARLTGAGWGGCCVSLVAEERVSSFIEGVQRLYFDQVRREEIRGLHQRSYLFVTTPAGGAAYVVVSSAF